MKKQVNGRDVKLKKHVVTRCAYTVPIPVFSLVSANTKPVTRNKGVGQSLDFYISVKVGLPVEVEALRVTGCGLLQFN